MKKYFLLVLAILMVLTSVFMTGCTKSGDNETTSEEVTGAADEATVTEEATTTEAPTVEAKPVKIGVMLYNTEAQFKATQAFYDQLAKEIDGLEFVYATAESMDAEANLSTCEGLIAQGCNGIITTVGTGLLQMTEACQEQGVYITTLLLKPDVNDEAAISNLTSYLGGVTDGAITGAERGIAAAQFIIDKGYKKVGTVTFPLTVMVIHNEAYTAFVETIDEFNATAAEADKITLTENTELFFKPLDASYFASHQDIDCVFSLAAGINFVYPTMVQAGVNGKIPLVTNGMRYDEDALATIKSGDIAMTSFTATEQSFYPVALIYDAVNGQSYADAPAVGTIVGCSTIYLSGAEDLAAMQENSYYFRSSDDEIERLLLKPADAKMLLKTYNPDATYAGLTAYLSNLGIEAFRK